MACTFCKKQAKLADSKDRFAFILGSELVVNFVDDTHGQYLEASVETLQIPILYCPICGEKLEI